MTETEVKTWVGEHSLRYPAFRAWLAKQADVGRMVAEVWLPLFRDVTLSDARDVSQAMFADKSEPVGFGAHAREVAWRASNREARRTAKRAFATFGTGTVGCPLCHDCGTVYVRHVDAAIRAYPGCGAWKLVVFACSCAKGLPHVGDGVRRYNAQGREEYVAPTRPMPVGDPLPAETVREFSHRLRGEVREAARRAAVKPMPGPAEVSAAKQALLTNPNW